MDVDETLSPQETLLDGQRDGRVELGREVVDGHRLAEPVDFGEFSGAETGPGGPVAGLGVWKGRRVDDGSIRLLVSQKDEAMLSALVRRQWAKVFCQHISYARRRAKGRIGDERKERERESQSHKQENSVRCTCTLLYYDYSGKPGRKQGLRERTKEERTRERREVID